ncbi:formylglycine-generating enzyme family protein [Embleya sp. NPDC059237]|uniref:formylglycine-generating enzyme family protein n=1 Tax=Embleya sp. NPDC059237 TaxID=3346784 RepID=UPI0036C8492D
MNTTAAGGRPAPEWIRIDGGICAFGDTARPITVRTLWWTRTPVTPAQLDIDADDRPMTGLTHAQAADVAAHIGGRLPRSVEWEWAAAGAARRRYPWGDQVPTPAHANLREDGPGTATPVQAHALGATPDGLLDMAGNTWEWTASPVMGGGYIIRGGSCASPCLYARCTFLNAAPAELASPGIGLRVVRTP